MSAPSSIRPPPVRGLWALGFVALSLVALVAVPVYFGQRVAVVQMRITEVLEPAARLSSNLLLLKARQFARMEGYLATEDANTLDDSSRTVTNERMFRGPYLSAAAEEEAVLAQLEVLAPRLDAVPSKLGGPSFFDRLVRLRTESVAWRFGNQRLFELGVDDGTRDRVLAGYNDVQRATRELDQSIQVAMADGRRRVANEQRRQTRITRILAVLALLASLILSRVAYRYRALTTEREIRRRKAVRRRREIDALLEATDDGVLGIDLEGCCISLNRSGARLLGWPENEIRGRDVVATLFHTDADGAAVEENRFPFARMVAAGEHLRSDAGAVIWRRKGSSFPARWSLQPMIDGLELRGAVLTFTDMTQIREKEEALRRAIRQREDVVAIVSHDLRNPLGVTLASADLLLDLPLDEGERRHQAEIIRRSGKRMQRLIEDLLDVARMESGAIVIRPSYEPIAPILDEARDLFLEQGAERSISLVVGDGDLSARVDRDRIIQALTNLLENALRLTPEGGCVTLSVDRDGDDALISVDDTGPGIPPELLGGLFDRFAQGDELDRGAVGLGLSIVKGVATAHGGDASVISALGEGSRFTLRLPIGGPPDLARRVEVTP